MDQVSEKFDSDEAGWATLETRWDARTRMAGKMLADADCVVDIGCGLMALRDVLPPTTRYIPVDLVPRGPDTVIVDFNNERLPEFDARDAALLGVIEYVHDLEAFLPQLLQFDRVIITYNHFWIQDIVRYLRRKPTNIGWRHRLSLYNTMRVFERSGFEIVSRHRVRMGEAMYHLRPRRR